MDKIRFVVAGQDSTEEIMLYEDNGIHYAFLPSYAGYDNTVIYAGSGDTLYIDGQQRSSGGDLTGLEFNRAYTVKIKSVLGITDRDEQLVIMRSENIPAVSIQLVEGRLSDIDADKTVKKTGTVTVIRADGSVDYSGSFRSVKGRGNASWNAAKKSYKLEFDTAINLVELGANREWVLLANAYDPSNLKTKLIFEAAAKLGIRYVSDTQFADLYVNGEYRGLYLLTEKLEIGTDSVDIYDLASQTQIVNYKKLSAYEPIETTNNENGCRFIRAYDIPNNPADISGGYLLKIDAASRITEGSYFIVEKGNTFALESPKYATAEQMEYISGLFNEMRNSLGNHEALSRLIDTDSFINRYLINECFANYESSSNYFVKESDAVDSRICAEPLWDFDVAWGRSKTANPEGIYGLYDFVGSMVHSSSIMAEQVREKYFSDMAPILRQTLLAISAYGETIAEADRMNKLRWRSLYGEENALDTQTAFLTDYLERRVAFLERYWEDPSRYVLVSFSDPEGVMQGYFASVVLEAGSGLGEIAALEQSGYRFLGWYDRATDAVLDPAEPIMENRNYAAKWEVDGSTSGESTVFHRLISLMKSMLNGARKDPGKYLAYIWCVMLLVLLAVMIARDLPFRKTRRKRHG